MSRETSLPTPWAELSRAVGGVEQLADVCGASAMSVWRWAHGKSPAPATVLAILAKLAKDHRIKVPTEWHAERRRERLDVSDEFRTWVGILARCYDTRHPRYAEWGGVGVSMCARWRQDFVAFDEGIGARPSPKHELELVDEAFGFDCGRCSDCTKRGVTERNARWTKHTAAARG